MAALPEMITFPAGVLGLEPVRIPIVGRGEDWLALAKPAGLAVGADPLDARSPDLVAALAAAVAAGKPQLAKLGLTRAGRVHALDAAVSGVLVLAVSAAGEAQMRNAVGARQWEFVYDLVAQTGRHDEAAIINCDLPLVRHATELRMLVSHASGKKCDTVFKPVRALGRWTRWEARTRDNRPHQVRVHAAESGLRIPGESTYGSVPRVFLSDLKTKYRGDRDQERPLHASLALHLRAVEFDVAGSRTQVTAPRPKSFDVLLRRLEEAAVTVPRVLRF